MPKEEKEEKAEGVEQGRDVEAPEPGEGKEEETPEEEIAEESRPKAVVEEVQETSEEQTAESKPGGNFKVVFVTALITAIIVAALAGGVYVYLSGIGRLPEVSVERGVSEIPTPTPTPTPTPKPEVDLSAYSVQVLNGSGTAGAAGAAEKLLVGAGFVVADTRNAKTFGFTDTIVAAKKDVPEAVIDEAQIALAEDYSIKVGEALDEDSDYDVVITVGSK